MVESEFQNILNTNSHDHISLPKQEFEDLKQIENFFKFSHDLLCIASFEGYIKRVNTSVSQTLGYSEEELVGSKIMDYVHPEDRERTIQGREEVVKGKALKNYENRYVTKKGETVWLSWTSIPDNGSQCIFAIAKDVTLRKKQEEEKNKLHEDIASINKELKHFARTASHDLRSPVNNILSIFSLIDVSKITDADTLELIDLLKSTTHQLHETLENYINDLVRKDNSHIVITSIDIAQILNTVTYSIEALIKKSGAVIKKDFSAFEKIDYNKTYLESIFLNLMTNAIKYCSPSITPVINFTARIKNDQKQILISDNGLGFDLALVKDRLFKMWETFHHHPDSKGMGLYLVQKHVSDLGGHIELESEVNKGSTFIITFK
ncbi:MAG: PAS domain-containing sensor histidine kinase [Pelobium sp.]